MDTSSSMPPIGLPDPFTCACGTPSGHSRTARRHSRSSNGDVTAWSGAAGGDLSLVVAMPRGSVTPRR
jgi:hypothetical protein